MPSDVRKAFGFPASLPSGFGLCPVFGAQPEFIIKVGWTRGALPHIDRQSRACESVFRQAGILPLAGGDFSLERRAAASGSVAWHGTRKQISSIQCGAGIIGRFVLNFGGVSMKSLRLL